MAKRGRKPFLEYEPSIAERLIEALRSGVSIHDACAYVGISQDTYFNWIRRGQTGKEIDSLYLKFFNEATRARVSGRVGAASVVRIAALGDSKRGIKPDVNAAMWYLERQDPATWGRKDMLIALGLDGQQLKQLKQQADSAGIDLSEVFEAMLNEFANSTANREE